MQLRLALVALAAAASATTAVHAAPVGGSAGAEVTILAPNQVTSTRNLQFGSIAKPTSGTTTVTVPSAETGTATPTLSGGNAFIPTAGQAHAATFRITGTAGQGYTVSAPTLTFPSAGSNLAGVGAEAATAAGTLGTMPGDGDDDIFIGGHFQITPTTAVQTYTGTLSVTVNFN